MIKEPMPFGLRIAIINRAFRKKKETLSVFYSKNFVVRFLIELKYSFCINCSQAKYAIDTYA